MGALLRELPLATRFCGLGIRGSRSTGANVFYQSEMFGLHVSPTRSRGSEATMCLLDSTEVLPGCFDVDVILSRLRSNYDRNLAG